MKIIDYSIALLGEANFKLKSRTHQVKLKFQFSLLFDLFIVFSLLYSTLRARDAFSFWYPSVRSGFCFFLIPLPLFFFRLRVLERAEPTQLS